MSELAGAPVADRGLMARVVGMVTAPGDTLRAVIQSPRPVGVLLLVCLALAVATAGPQFTEKGRRAMLEMQIQQTERFTGQPVPPEAYARMEQQTASVGPYLTLVGIFVMVPITTLIFTALYWAGFNAFLGGTGTFKQVLAIVTHSQVITAIGALVSAPIQYFQNVVTPGGPFSLVALAPMLDPDGFAASFLGMLTVFQIWSVVVTAIGLALLYRRKTGSVFAALLVVHVLITAAFAALPFLFSR